jgi:hypothetical protein
VTYVVLPETDERKDPESSAAVTADSISDSGVCNLHGNSDKSSFVIGILH